MMNEYALPAVWESVRAAQQGDRAAFGSIYRRYRDSVYLYVLNRTRVVSMAEDITSETFLRVLRNIESVSYEGKDLRAWITTIARNVTIDYQRSAHARWEVLSGQPFHDVPVADGPESALMVRQLQDEMQVAVAALNPRQRECIFLRFYRGFTVGQTAAAMGSNAGAIRALQYRAILQLTAAIRRTAASGEDVLPMRGAA